jgi:hypothetical protein
MAKLSEASSEVIHIAERLIDKHHPHLRDAKIGFVFQDPAPSSGGRDVLGKAQKVTSLMQVYLNYDFIIVLAEIEFIALSTERRVALIDHQLCHLAKEDGMYKLRGHDIEEFHAVIQRHGFWNADLLRISEDDVAHDLKQLSLFGEAVKKIGKVEAVDVTLMRDGQVMDRVEIEAPAEVA